MRCTPICKYVISSDSSGSGPELSWLKCKMRARALKGRTWTKEEGLGLVLGLALGLDVFGAMAIEGQMKDLMMEIQEDNCVDMGSSVYNQTI